MNKKIHSDSKLEPHSCCSMPDSSSMPPTLIHVLILMLRAHMCLDVFIKGSYG